MAVKVNEFYVCDRCGKTIENYSNENQFTDIRNAYFYDLCEDCKKDFEAYTTEVKTLDSQYDELAKKHRFGKYVRDDSNEG